MTNERATSPQLAYIEGLLKKNSLDTKIVTKQYELYGIHNGMTGRSVSDWLTSLTKGQASIIIGKLKEVNDETQRTD